MKRAVKEKELEKEKTEKAVSEEKETKEAAASEKENKETSEKEEKASEKKKDPKDEKIDELNDKLKRSMAEFDNYRKRTDKDKSAMYEIGAKDVIEKILRSSITLKEVLIPFRKTRKDPRLQTEWKRYISNL